MTEKGNLGRKHTPLKGECGDGKAEKKRLMNEEIMSGG